MEGLRSLGVFTVNFCPNGAGDSMPNNVPYTKSLCPIQRCQDPLLPPPLTAPHCGAFVFQTSLVLD